MRFAVASILEPRQAVAGCFENGIGGRHVPKDKVAVFRANVNRTGVHLSIAPLFRSSLLHRSERPKLRNRSGFLQRLQQRRFRNPNVTLDNSNFGTISSDRLRPRII